MKANRWLIAGLLLIGLSLGGRAEPVEPRPFADNQQPAQLNATGSVPSDGQLFMLLRQMAARLGAQEKPSASGITYHHELVPVGRASAQVDYLRIEDYAQHYRLTVALPPTGLGTALPLSKLLEARGGAAGINASFFDPATNLPVGFLLIDGQMQSASYGRRAVAGIDLFGRLSLFNPQVGQLSLGNSARLLYRAEMESQQMLLRDAISAGPLLLHDGKVALNAGTEDFSDAFVKSRTARSALGLTSDGTLIMVVVSRSRQSAGMSLPELARFLQQLGVAEAMALDGGSSSALAFRQGGPLRTIGSQRPIPVALVLLPR